MGFVHDAVRRRGHQVEFFASEHVPRWARGRVGRHAFPLLVRHTLQQAGRSGRPFDIVNVHEPVGAFVHGVARASATKIVVTSHGLEERAWEVALEEADLGRGGPTLRSRVLHPLTTLWQARRAISVADHVFCLNDDDRRYLQRTYRRPPETITRIFPGADLRFLESARGRSYDSAVNVLFAGTWRQNKGVRDLVPAIVTLFHRDSRAELLVLGHGVPDDTVREAFPASLRERVRCLHAANEDETAAAFADADVFVLPSLFEGTPLTLMEAMMSGLPIVTTETCGMKDVIRDGDNGLIVPIRDPAGLASALERLLADADLRARLGRAAQADARENYTWDAVGRPVWEAYERLAAY